MAMRAREARTESSLEHRDLTVAMAIQCFRPIIGGAEVQLERLLPLLAARGVHARVLTRAVDGTLRHERVAGAVVYRTPLAGESPAASIAYVGGSLVDVACGWSDIDVVHAHGLLSPATIALGASLLGKPCVVTPLGAGPPGDLARLRRKPAGTRRLSMLVRRAHFVALSNEIADELITAGVPSARVWRAPNGVDVDTCRPLDADERARRRSELGFRDSHFVGVFVGRLHPVKRVDILLRAAAHVPNAHVLIVGDGSERPSLERLARGLGIEDRVSFVGFTTRVPDYLGVADAFFLPSVAEGMPNALLEAMACGLACVASVSIGGVEELLAADRGVTVAPGDVPAWSRAMRRLATDVPKRKRFGAAAAHHVRATYSLDAAADRLAALYRRVAAGR